MYYVDREEEALVKAEDSDLRDAKDNAVIHSSAAE